MGRSWLAGLAAGLFLAATTAGHSAEIKVGFTPTTFDSPMVIVKQKGWLQEELAKAGLKDSVVWVPFSAGPPQNEAFAAKQLDITASGDVPILIGKAAGLPLKAVGLASAGWYSSAAVVLKDSPIKTVQDLKGRKVATQKGTTGHQLLLLALAEAGLKVSDIQFVNLPLPDLAGAVANGDVEAAVVMEPGLSSLEVSGTIRTLRDGKGLKNSIILLVGREDFIAANPKVVEALTRAYRRAATLIAEKPDEAAQVLGAEIRLPVAALRHSIAKFEYDPAFKAEHIASLKGTEAYLREQGVIRSGVNIDAFVDLSFTAKPAAK